MYPEAFQELMMAWGKPQWLPQVYEQSGYRGVLEYTLKSSKLHARPDKAPALSAYRWAELYVNLEDKRHALEALRTGLAVHDPAMIYLKIDPVFDSLRSEPAFQHLERQLGLNRESGGSGGQNP
jgi:hypothetical protein